MEALVDRVMQLRRIPGTIIIPRASEAIHGQAKEVVQRTWMMIHNHTTVTGLRHTQMTQPRDVEEDQVVEVLIQHTIQPTELMTPIFHHCRQTHDMIAGVICQVLMILDMVQRWTETRNRHVLTRPNLL